MRAPPRRAALDQQQALGHEDEDLAAAGAGRRATRPRRRPSGRACPGPARKPTSTCCAPASGVAQLQLDAREALAPGDQLLVAPRARRAPAQREPGASRRLVLPVAFAPDHDVEPGSEADRGVAVRAEVDESQAGDDHTRYSRPPTPTTSPAWSVRGRAASRPRRSRRTSPDWMSILAWPPVRRSAGELEERPERQGRDATSRRATVRRQRQLLRRIGMMRYVKSSAGPLTRPGRSGLVKRSGRGVVDGVDALDEIPRG